MKKYLMFYPIKLHLLLEFKKYNIVALGILIILLSTSCGNKNNSIEKNLHGGSDRVWGAYDKKFKSLNFSYQLYLKDNRCWKYKEKFYVYAGKTCIDGLYDMTWGVKIANDNIYLRCMFDCYKVLNYNEKYFKLLTQKGDTIYLCQTTCQSNDCLIPETVDPAPF